MVEKYAKKFRVEPWLNQTNKCKSTVKEVGGL
jgi:hypothetical protein